MIKVIENKALTDQIKWEMNERISSTAGNEIRVPIGGHTSVVGSRRIACLR